MTTATGTAASRPREIRADIHHDAIDRVSRFFNATVRDCLNEIMQNSRRAGATGVVITTNAAGRISVTDDGSGIADPQSLLSFGLSDWSETTSNSEDPAGMGVYALARMRDITITSHCPATGAAWQVELDEEIFSGARAGTVQPINPADIAPGTTVAFTTNSESRYSYLEEEAKRAARFYPLPVTINGHDAEQKDFLADCSYIEEWQGLRIGVKNQRRHYGEPGINFHGVTIEDQINCHMITRRKDWQTMTDVVDAPQMELTLPARKDVVKNDFIDALQTACRRATYRAMAQSETVVEISFRQQKEAAELGVTLPTPPSRLHAWQPNMADRERMDYHPDERRNDVLADSIRVEAATEAREDLTLAIALEDSEIIRRMYSADSQMSGFVWYEEMTVLDRIETVLHMPDGSEINLFDEDSSSEDQPAEDPERIVHQLRFRDKDGHVTWLEVEGKIALWYDEDGYEGLDYRPMIAKGQTIEVEQLTELLVDAYLTYSDDSSADSRETQTEYFRNEARQLALQTLLNEKEAISATLKAAVNTHVRHRLPSGWNAVIYLQENEPPEIELDEA